MEQELLAWAKGESMTKITAANYCALTSSYLSGSSETAVPDSLLKAASQKYIKENDANKDGVLTKDEVKWSAEAFDKADVNKDGHVDEGEIKATLTNNESTVYRLLSGKSVKLQKYSLIKSALGSI